MNSLSQYYFKILFFSLGISFLYACSPESYSESYSPDDPLNITEAMLITKDSKALKDGFAIKKAEIYRKDEYYDYSADLSGKPALDFKILYTMEAIDDTYIIDRKASENDIGDNSISVLFISKALNKGDTFPIKAEGKIAFGARYKKYSLYTHFYLDTTYGSTKKDILGGNIDYTSGDAFNIMGAMNYREAIAQNRIKVKLIEKGTSDEEEYNKYKASIFKNAQTTLLGTWQHNEIFHFHGKGGLIYIKDKWGISKHTYSINGSTYEFAIKPNSLRSHYKRCKIVHISDKSYTINRGTMVSPIEKYTKIRTYEEMNSYQERLKKDILGSWSYVDAKKNKYVYVFEKNGRLSYICDTTGVKGYVSYGTWKFVCDGLMEINYEKALKPNYLLIESIDANTFKSGKTTYTRVK